MRVVFLSPRYPPEMRQFTRGLAEVGAEVLGSAMAVHYERYRAHIVEDTLLRPGAPRRDWKATLLSDGYLVVRHPDWEQAHQMAMAAATDIQLYAS